MSQIITSPTRRISAQQVELLRSLTPGQKVRIVQTVRVGAKKWQATVEGTFSGLKYLATGVTTDRVPEDDVIVPTLHFTKPNGELSSIAVDENSVITVVS